MSEIQPRRRLQGAHLKSCRVCRSRMCVCVRVEEEGGVSEKDARKVTRQK